MVPVILGQQIDSRRILESSSKGEPVDDSGWVSKRINFEGLK